MLKTLELKGVVSDAICIRKNRKNYILYVEDLYNISRRNGKALYIVNYATFNTEEPQMLKIFANSTNVRITYTGGYLYVAEYNLVNKLTRYSIMQENGKSSLHEEEDIHFSSKDEMRLQSITSSKSGKVAVYDMYDGNIYEIRKNGKRSVRNTSNGRVIVHQNLCYVGNRLISSRDVGLCSKSEEILDKYSYAVKAVFHFNDYLYFCDKTNEMVFGIENVILFEKDNSFNGLIFLGDRKIASISSNLAGGLIVASNDYSKRRGYINILNQNDIEFLKELSFENMEDVREKNKKIMQSIVDLSDGNVETFLKLSKEYFRA